MEVCMSVFIYYLWPWHLTPWLNAIDSCIHNKSHMQLFAKYSTYSDNLILVGVNTLAIIGEAKNHAALYFADFFRLLWFPQNQAQLELLLI